MHKKILQYLFVSFIIFLTYTWSAAQETGTLSGMRALNDGEVYVLRKATGFASDDPVCTIMPVKEYLMDIDSAGDKAYFFDRQGYETFKSSITGNKAYDKAERVRRDKFLAENYHSASTDVRDKENEKIRERSKKKIEQIREEYREKEARINQEIKNIEMQNRAMGTGGRFGGGGCGVEETLTEATAEGRKELQELAKKTAAEKSKSPHADNPIYQLTLLNSVYYRDTTNQMNQEHAIRVDSQNANGNANHASYYLIDVYHQIGIAMNRAVNNAKKADINDYNQGEIMPGRENMDKALDKFKLVENKYEESVYAKNPFPLDEADICSNGFNQRVSNNLEKSFYDRSHEQSIETQKEFHRRKIVKQEAALTAKKADQEEAKQLLEAMRSETESGVPESLRAYMLPGESDKDPNLELRLRVRAQPEYYIDEYNYLAGALDNMSDEKQTSILQHMTIIVQELERIRIEEERAQLEIDSLDEERLHRGAEHQEELMEHLKETKFESERVEREPPEIERDTTGSGDEGEDIPGPWDYGL